MPLPIRAPAKTEFSFDALEWRKILQALRGYASNEIGKELVDSLEPSIDHATIEACIDINAECLDAVKIRISFPIQGCCETKKIAKSLSVANTVLSVDEVNGILINLEIAGRMKKSFSDRKQDFSELFSLTQKLFPHSGIVTSIRKKIDETGMILDSASPELKKLRSQQHRLQLAFQKALDLLVRKFSRDKVLQEEHFTIRNGRHVLPVKASHSRRFQGITHDVSSTGSTLFMEPFEIVERNNEINRLKALEEEEIRNILSDISIQLAGIAEDIYNNQDILADLDFHYACGCLAYRLGAEKPVLTRSNTLKLLNARHPILLLNAEKPADIIPLSITLGDKFHTLIISGPNAGGKTVTLKTMGLLCLMVQCGLLIPASQDSQFPVFRRIIAEIGDPQSLDDNLSTFSARLLNIKKILDDLSSDNLVLLDELGAGTDPKEGISLAIAIIKYIGSRNALQVVSTHHGGLKVFASETKGIENCSLAFNKKSLKPTFVLSVGIPGSSYALELSRKTGLPEEIIKETQSQLGEDQLKVEDFIRELESRIEFYKKKNTEAELKKKQLDSLVEQYTDLLQGVKREYHEKFEEYVLETEDRFVEFNRNIERQIKEIREKQAAGDAVKQIKNEIHKETKRLRQTQKKQKVLFDGLESDTGFQEIQVGDPVIMKGHNQTGLVIAENKDKNTMTVQMESIKLEINKNKLQKTKPLSKTLLKDSVPVISVEPEIDLRGLMSNDAVESVDTYISDAIATGLTTVRLIHGKGSGSLRRNISEFLKHDDRIEDFRLGAWGEGDTGVTIVKLK